MDQNKYNNEFPRFAEKLKPFSQRIKELFSPRIISPKAGYSAEARTFGEKAKDLFASTAGNVADKIKKGSRYELLNPLSSGSLFKTAPARDTGPVFAGGKDPIKTSPSPTSTPTPTPVKTSFPSIAATPPDQRPFHSEISGAFGNISGEAHNVLSRLKDGQPRGENTTYKFGPEIDVDNKTKWDPVLKKRVWNNDPDAPVDQKLNPFSGNMENSTDRGLFRINNATFWDYLADSRPGFREAMYRAGIIDSPHDNWEGLTPAKIQEYWDRMLDPELNIKMAKIIYDKQGWKAWMAAPEEYKK